MNNAGKELWLSLNEAAFRQFLSAVCFVEKAFRIATLNKEDLFLLILSE